jgi:hypothetical protein
MIKGIHLTLEVKTSFGNSTPAMGSSTEFNSQKLVVPTNSQQRLRRNRRKEDTCTQQLKVKLERLRSARLTRHD